MKKFFLKHETLFCIFLIVLYVVLNSFCIQTFGETSPVSFIINTVLSLLLLGLAAALGRIKYYRLCIPQNGKKHLYFIPLALIVSVNLLSGININRPTGEIIFHILTMLNIGFIEEIIFRGFLFQMMAKTSVKSAIIVTSITFGVGHIINLLNGAEFVPTLVQIISAVSVGYLFAVILNKSKSLVPCIITHSLINSLSVFYDPTPIVSYLSSAFLIAAPLLYALHINKSIND